MKKFSLKTKRNSRLNSNEKDVKKFFLWLLVAILLLYGFRSAVNVASSWITTPFFSLQHYIETSSATVPVFIRSRNELLEYIRSLEHEISSRQGIDNLLAKKIQENDSLRVLLHASGTPRIAAGIIARPPYIPYDVLLIDRGSEDGIQENAPVYYGEEKILGYVQKVFSSHALVTLISSPGVETTVYIFGPDIFSTAQGQGGGVVRINVPQGLTVGAGDTVITPSIESGVLGSVERVESNPTEPEQYAYLTYDVPLQSMRLVSVGMKPLSTISFEEARGAVVEQENEFLRFDIPLVPNPEDSGGATSTPSDLIEETI